MVVKRSFFCLSLAFACGCAGVAQDVNADANDEWAELMPLASNSQMLGACRDANGGIVVVGERGHLLRSLDEGQTWKQELVPTRATLTGIHASAEGTLVVVGHQGTLLRWSPASGDSWSRVQAGLTMEANLLAVYSPCHGRWWALGAYGLFLESLDDGVIWTQRSIAEVDLHLHAVIALSDEHYLIPGEGGLLLESRDGGSVWEEIDSPYDGSLFGGCVLPSGEVLLHGLRGHVFVGHPDSGEWREVKTPIQTLIASHALLDDGRVVLGAAGGYFLIARPEEWVWQVWNDDQMPLTSQMLPLADASVLVCGGRGAKRLTLSTK